MGDRAPLVESDADDHEIAEAATSIALHQRTSHTELDSGGDVATDANGLAVTPDGVFVDSESSPSPSRPMTPINIAPSKKRYEDFSTIDWARDAANEWARQKALASKKNMLKQKLHWHSRYASLYDASQGWIVITLVGSCAGLIAGILNICIEWLNDIKLGACQDAWFLPKSQCCWAAAYTGGDDCASWKYWSDYTSHTGSSAYMVNFIVYLLFAALFAMASAFLVKRLAPYAAGSGLAEIKVILGGFIIRGYFGFWTLVVKTLGIVLALSSGLNLGNEGPMVHISLCLGNVFTRLFKKFNTNEAKRREILSAAAAIGVAAAFNAPIGGVLYSLEEVSYYFPHKTMWRAFFGCLIAAITLSYMNPLSYRDDVFGDRDWHWFEVPAIMILGVFGVCALRRLIRSVIRLAGAVWRRLLLLQRQDVRVPQKQQAGQVSHHRGRLHGHPHGPRRLPEPLRAVRRHLLPRRSLIGAQTDGP